MLNAQNMTMTIWSRYFALFLLLLVPLRAVLTVAKDEDSQEKSGTRWLRSYAENTTLQYIIDANLNRSSSTSSSLIAANPSFSNQTSTLNITTTITASSNASRNHTTTTTTTTTTTFLESKEESVVLLNAVQQETSRQEQVRLTSFGGNPSPDRFPLQRCQGDCDNDSQCEGSLLCYQRDEIEAVPGCEGGESDTSRTDYCIDPVTAEGITTTTTTNNNNNNPVQQVEDTPAPTVVPAQLPPPPSSQSSSSQSSSSSSCDSFFVALLADPQVGWNLNGYNSQELFRVAASHLRDLKPEFILVAGDMIQSAGSRNEYRTSKSIMDSISIPYHVVAGNHDVQSNPRMDLLNEFVQDWDIPYYWYTVRHCNTLFVMLDSNILRARDEEEAEDEVVALAVEQLEWLDATLREANQNNDIDHIIPIAHHPLATRRLDEESKGTNTPSKVRQDLAKIYVANAGPKLKYVFAGHFHDSARISDDSSGIDYVTYPATGVILGSSPREPSGFAILRIEGKSLRENYYGYDDMPKSI